MHLKVALIIVRTTNILRLCRCIILRVVRFTNVKMTYYQLCRIPHVRDFKFSETQIVSVYNFAAPSLQKYSLTKANQFLIFIYLHE